MDNRKMLVTALALVLGAAFVLVCSIFAADSISGGSPSVPTVVVRVLALTLTAGTYVAVLLYYSKRNVSFREKLDAAVSAPLPDKKKKKKKR